MKKFIFFILIFYFIFQLLTLDYGLQINDIGYIRAYKFDNLDFSGTALERNQITDKSGFDEGFKKWMVRYKLYSIEADEVYNIMALSRIKPNQLKFDPHYYAYGGAYLYPLGLFLFFLLKIGILKSVDFLSLLSQPDLVDAIYIYGRAFVLTTFVLSGYVLYRTLRLVTTYSESVLGLCLYLIAPASIMFSQIFKPHWYALLWGNLALLLVVKLFKQRELKLSHELLIGVFLGLAVGSTSTYTLFSVSIWVALALAAKAKIVPKIVLFRIPFIALLFYFLSNPYIILNYSSYQREVEIQKTWFYWGTHFKYLYFYIKNSLLTGFGVVFVIFFMVICLKELVKSSFPKSRMYILGLFAVVLLYSSLTASMSSWHINFRYIPYFLPCSFLLVSLSSFKNKGKWLAIALVAGIVQIIPLKTAYFDENNQGYSTRLSSAKWINENIPQDEIICSASEMTPYNSPPFDFTKYILNKNNCRYLIIVEREMDTVNIKEGYNLYKRFRPRFTPTLFPLVFSHINPQISIYKKITE